MFSFLKRARRSDQNAPGDPLRSGLSKTRQRFQESFLRILFRKKVIDAEILSALSQALLTADVGVYLSQQILDTLREQVDRHQLNDPEALVKSLKAQLIQLLQPVEKAWIFPNHAPPASILLVGINGAGKTTSIGKLAHHFTALGKTVLLAAGDTFRAAAIEQLTVWGERNQIPVIAQPIGSDSASVIFDALQSAQAKKRDLVLADTAGRLQTQSHLMDELKKIKRVMTKAQPEAPDEIWLVLDASIGQNGLKQAQEFSKAVGVTGLIMTKLDGTAKGGIVFSIAQELNLPIYYLGVGEGIEDLEPFSAQQFVESLLEREAE